MLKPRLIIRMSTFALALMGAGAVSGQAYPDKPIRILTSEVGGGNDFGARLVAQALTVSVGQQVVVENRPSGLIGESEVKERFFNTGVETVGDSPAGLTATIKSELARMGKVIKEAGIRAE